MFKHVLAAIDLSEISAEIVAEAIQLAQYYDAKLILLHVISTEEELYLPYSLYPVIEGYSNFSETALKEHEERVKIHKDRCQQSLDVFRTHAVGQGVNTQTTLVSGEPAHAICDAIETWQGDLVVLGHRGLTGLKEMVVGSVSNHVMHHAPCSVLILRPTSTDETEVASASTSVEVTP